MTIAVTAVPETGCQVASLGDVSGTVTRSGSWTSDCDSVNRSGSYARFYSFSVGASSDVRIDVTSSEDGYMFLLNGSDTDGSEVDSDDDGGGNLNPRIEQSLAAGDYTVEATTYYEERMGDFTADTSR